jgi:ribulose-phosphate 3-epimerase
MTEIIPGILVHTLKELKQKLQLLSWAKKVHIDIMDGKFVPNKTIQLRTLSKALPKMDMQIHLMAYKPHKYISGCANLGAKEFIFHSEATKNSAETLEMAREYGLKAGIAFNPETGIERHKDALVHADLALVMTVHPGFSGQAFLKTPVRKIGEVKKYNPIISIGVDGGINEHTCRLAKAADFAIATRAVTDAEEPLKAYRALTKRCKQ